MSNNTLPTFHCGNRVFSTINPLIIAEVGTAHNGSLKTAQSLIEAAAESGANCIKFQWVYADEILPPNAGFVPLPGGHIRLYDRFKQLESVPEFYAELKHLTEKAGCMFLCSPFGPQSATELLQLHPDAVKIASPELNYIQLLQQCAASDAALILSTGVSQELDIQKAIIATKPAKNRLLLHCVTNYPAPETDYNLNLIPAFWEKWQLPIGVSDHSLDPLIVPLTALACGAVAIEKHITLSRSGTGLDDPVALEPEQFSKMSRELRIAAACMAENPDGQQFRKQLQQRYGNAKIEAVCGTGLKTLAPSEAMHYGRTNRSIHAKCNIGHGELITYENVAILRTEKELRPGLAPDKLECIIGKYAATAIPAGEGIRAIDITDI